MRRSAWIPSADLADCKRWRGFAALRRLGKSNPSRDPPACPSASRPYQYRLQVCGGSRWPALPFSTDAAMLSLDRRGPFHEQDQIVGNGHAVFPTRL